MTLQGHAVSGEWTQVTPAYPRKKRMVAVIGGMEKTGKTTLAASGPDPVYVLGIDRGSEAIAVKSQGRTLYLKQYVSPKDLQPAEYAAVWSMFKSDYYGVLKANKGTLVVDTETAMYELIRLATFGKLANVTPEQYGPLNAELNHMVDAAFNSDISVMFTRRTAPVYRGREFTGQYEDAGWRQMPYAAEVRIWTYRCTVGMCPTANPMTGTVLHPNGDGFHARIRDTRWHPELIGTDWSDLPPYMMNAQMMIEHLTA